MIPEVARLSRRGVVGATAVGALTGCSGGGSKAPAPRRAPSPGAVATARAAAESLGLLRQYDAAAAAHPELAVRLAPLRAEVARHVAAFGGKAPGPAATAAPLPAARSRKPSPSPSRTPAPATSVTAPETPAASLSWLAVAERALADRRAAALLAVPGELARLLASVAAAGAGHVVLLGQGARKA